MKKLVLVCLLASLFPTVRMFGQLGKNATTLERVAKIEVTPLPFPPESAINVAVTFKQKATEAPNANAFIQLRAYEVAETDGEPGGNVPSKASFSTEVPTIPSDGSEVTVTFTNFKVPTIASDKSLYLKVWYVFKRPKLGYLSLPIGSAKFFCDSKGDPKAARCLFGPK